ncbi:MAG: amino acid ABC transporter permease [Mollicutes bacterium]|jgi:His/Glu/Gln/Arg/opine family amino acid ABC transporter permease subunit|nr:amino acid ABC transporter permease [Mollicutes bacterium]
MTELYKTLIYDQRYLLILNGLKNTIIITIGALIIGIAIGILITIVQNNYKANKKNKLLYYLANLYVKIIRGTPVLLQLMIIYYIIFKSSDISIIIIGIIAFGINSGAYVSEIFRTGIEAVDKGQMEAGRSLGLKYRQIMNYIILPQAFKISLPALGNEFVTLIKETSVAGYIGIIELTKSGDIIASRTYNYFFPLIITALIYLVLTLGITKLLKKLEKGDSNA